MNVVQSLAKTTLTVTTIIIGTKSCHKNKRCRHVFLNLMKYALWVIVMNHFYYMAMF